MFSVTKETNTKKKIGILAEWASNKAQNCLNLQNLKPISILPALNLHPRVSSLRFPTETSLTHFRSPDTLQVSTQREASPPSTSPRLLTNQMNKQLDGENSVTVITISDLIRRAQPLTATSSPISPPSTSQKPQPQQQNPSPKVLTPYPYPAILIGTLSLPTESVNCPYKTCFQFSDGSASTSVCCDILDFGVHIIGVKLTVWSWNFIPFKRCSGGGFLEIIKWKAFDKSFELSHCSMFDSFHVYSCCNASLGNNVDGGGLGKSNCRYGVRGLVESVSPPSLVPCTMGDGKPSAKLLGFILRVLACDCKLCKRNSLEMLGVEDQHCFKTPMFVYFCGDSSCWHPAITKHVGRFVAISGVKKKLIVVRKEELLMFVITENSILRFFGFSEKRLGMESKRVIEAKGECGNYTGVVKCVYMQGMVVELDEDVWLLLTDSLLTAPHSLRAGAIITIRNAHFVNPNFSWAKMIVLGACFRTSITVEWFSPLETRCHSITKAESQLEKFIESLSFTARIWVLLLVSCFRKKFSGILSEKEILGSNKKDGLVKTFTSLHLPKSVFQARHGVFIDFYNHNTCHYNCEQYCGDLKLVAPFSVFLHYCEVLWTRALLQLEKNCPVLFQNTQSSTVPRGGKSFSQPLRKMFSSKEIGFSLLGYLKVSSTGRLQLIDATTCSIDVVISDLPSTWNANNVYEVFNYKLVLEGIHLPVDQQRHHTNSPFTCRHIFHSITGADRIKFTICAVFNFKDATLRSFPVNCAAWNDDFEGPEAEIFHVIWVAKKYPLLQKFQVDKVITNCCTMFADAIILPWDLHLCGKDGFIHLSKCSQNQLNEILAQYGDKIYDHMYNKKRKIDNEVKGQLSSESTTIHSCVDTRLTTCSCSSWGSAKRKSGHPTSSEIPCIAIIRSPDSQYLLRSGKLCCRRCNGNSSASCAPRMEKVLLEFDSRTSTKYQVGGYYIIRHNRQEQFCCLKKRYGAALAKVFIDANIHLWSVTMLSEDFSDNLLSSLDESSLVQNKFIKTGQHEIFARSNYSEFFTDVCLHLSANIVRNLEVLLKEMKEGIVKPVTALKGAIGEPSPPSVATYPAANCINFANESSNFKRTKFSSVSCTSVAVLRSDVPNGLISELLYRPKGKPMKLSCRVVATQILIVEKKGKSDNAKPSVWSEPHCFDIPVVCVLLDDGSSLCYCWASAEQASILLRLNEKLPLKAFEDSGFRMKRAGTESSWETGMFHLERIMKKHDRIMIKGRGFTVDSSSQDLSVSVSSTKPLSMPDENLLKFMVLNACSSSPLTVVASDVDAETSRKLEKDYYLKTEMAEDSVKSIWASEVCRIDALSEARRRLEELINE